MNCRTERTRITAGKGISCGLFALVAFALMFATCPWGRTQTSSRSSDATEDAIFQAISPDNIGLRESLRSLRPIPIIYMIPFVHEDWVSYPTQVTGSRPRVASYRVEGPQTGLYMHIIAFDQPEAAVRFSETGGPYPNDFVRPVGDRYVIWLRDRGSNISYRQGIRNQVLDIFEGVITGVLGSEQSEPPSVAKGGGNAIDVQDELVAQPPLPPVSDDTTDLGVVSVEDTPIEDYDPTGEIPAAITALGSLATAAITALGAGLMMLGMGVTPKDLIDGARDLFGGVNVPPPPPHPPAIHRDGEVNEFGEVWSDEDRGWIGRNLYEQERERRSWIADKAVTDLQSGQSEDVKRAYDRWLESRDRLHEMQDEGRRLDIEIEKLDLSMLERESSRGVSASETLDAFIKGTWDTTVDLVPDLVNPTVLWETAIGSGSEVWDSLSKAWDGKADLENYKAAGGAVLHSVKGMAEGVATIAKVGWHVVTNPLDSFDRVDKVLGAIESDPLGSIEIVTRATEKITDPLIDAKKPLSERIKGPVQLGLDIATGHALGLGLGRVINAAAELDAVKNLANRIGDLKTGIFGEQAVKTGQRIWGTGQTVGAEAEAAALLKIPADHPLRKIGAINEAAKEAGGKFNVRLVKGDRLLDTADPAYEKGMAALKTDPKYLTPEAREMADAVRYDQHLRAQQSAMQKMLAENPEFKGHIEGVDNTGSHAWKPGKYNPGSDIDTNLRGDGTNIGARAEEAYPEYYRRAVAESSKQTSGGRYELTPDDLKANCYGDGKAPGALTTPTGKDFVSSYKASGGGRVDVYDESGRYTHSLDGKDPLLGGDRPFFQRGSAAEAMESAKEFGRDVATKHFGETGKMDLSGKLGQAMKNTKTIGNITGKLTGGKLPEPVAAILKDPSALSKSEALGVLENFLRQQ